MDQFQTYPHLYMVTPLCEFPKKAQLEEQVNLYLNIP